jgi:catalase-peroxidase
MKTRYLLMLIAAAGLLAVSFLTVAVAADTASDNGEPKANKFWWPDQLDLKPLRAHDIKSNPYGAEFNYAKEFNSLDLAAVKKDINDVLTRSQDWWPADYGN